MRKFNLKHSLVVCLMFVFILASMIPTTSFAYTQGPTWGINNPFPSNNIFYTADGKVKTLYTSYNEVNFSFLSSPSKASEWMTSAFIRQETKLGSGVYSSWQNANPSPWGTGNQSGSVSFCKIVLPSEGRFNILINAFNANGIYLYSQQFTVVYYKDTYSTTSIWHKRIVNDVTMDPTIFKNNKGNWQNVSFTVQDLSGKGVTANDLSIKFCNLYWMQQSFGHASVYFPNDIKVAPSTINQNEYTVSFTVNASLFGYASGEYYLDVSTKPDAGTGYSVWSGMFPRLFI